MTIDVKRLAVDAGYWGGSEVPDGATHYYPPSEDWYKKTEDSVSVWWAGIESWQEAEIPGRLNDERFIPRPQPQPEWVDGLPPAGVECEFLTSTWRVGRVVCYVEGRHGKQGIVQFDNDWQYFSPEDVPGLVRPIPTPEQRQRDELIDLINNTGYESELIVDAILSRYTLEPKP